MRPLKNVPRVFPSHNPSLLEASSSQHCRRRSAAGRFTAPSFRRFSRDLLWQMFLVLHLMFAGVDIVFEVYVVDARLVP